MSYSSEIIRKFNRALGDFSMLEGKRGVLVGYSGGADSSALLGLFYGCCRERGIYLKAVHIHHGIRGAEADRDAEHCRLCCERLGIDFETVHGDIPSIASETGRGIEETARIFRYSVFSRILIEDARLDCVATAHNANDNAETLLFNLARGTGIDGLAGIPPVRKIDGGCVIRPIIYCTKTEILGYCRENGIEYIFDSTNEDTAYSRNYIRRELLPKLERLNPSYLAAIGRLSAWARSDAEYLGEVADGFVAANVKDGRISAAILSQAAEPVASRALIRMYAHTCEPQTHEPQTHESQTHEPQTQEPQTHEPQTYEPQTQEPQTQEPQTHEPQTCGRTSDRTLEAVHIGALLSLARKAKEGSSLSLPGRVTARISHGELYFTRLAADNTTGYQHELKPGVNRFENLDFAVLVIPDTANTQDFEKDIECLKNIYKLSIHTILKSDKINHILFIRTKRDGDAYVYGKMTRKLKKLYNDRGLDKERRLTLPVFCDADGIVWVPGFGVADRTNADNVNSDNVKSDNVSNDNVNSDNVKNNEVKSMGIYYYYNL